jgi:hypothetical protein
MGREVDADLELRLPGLRQLLALGGDQLGVLGDPGGVALR